MAGALAKLGVAAPNTPMGAGLGNELGHWESAPITALHDELLASAGSRWDDWRAFRADWYDTPVAVQFKARAKELLKDEFGQAPVFVLKDPRVCRFPRFWLEVLEEEGIDAKIVLPLRSPLEVAQSLRTRNGFPLKKGLLLWLRHVLDAEAASRGLQRSSFEWTQFLSNWRSVAVQLENSLGTRLPALTDYTELEVDRFLSHELKHESASEADLDTNPELHGWIAEAYAALCELARNPGSNSAYATLDALRARFDDAARLFGGVLASAEVAYADLEAAIQREREALNAGAEQMRAAWRDEMETALDRERQARTADVAVHEASLEAASAERNAKTEEITRLTHLIETMFAEHGQATTALRVEFEAGLSNLRQLRAEEDATNVATLAKLEAELGDKIEKVRSLEHLLSVSDENAASAQENLRQEFERKIAAQSDRLRSIEHELETEQERRRSEAAGHSEALQAVLTVREVAVSERDAAIAERKAVVAERDAVVVEREAAIAERDAKASELQHLVDALAQRASHFERRIATQEQQLADSAARADEMRKAFLSSTSWKVTRYVRSVGQLRRSFIRALRAMPQAAQLSGGSFAAARRSVRVLLREGFSGVAKRVEFLESQKPAAARNRALSTHRSASVDAEPGHARSEHGASDGPTSRLNQDRAQEAADREAPDSPKDVFRREAENELTIFLSTGGRIAFAPVARPLVSVVIVLYNQAGLTYKCLRSLEAASDHSKFSIEVVILDNASKDRTGDLLDRVDGARIIRSDENLHFLRGANKAACSAHGEYILFLNNDAAVSADSIANAIATIQVRDDVGAVGGRIVLLNGELQEAGSIIWADGSCAGYGRGQDPNRSEFMFERDVDYCSGVFLLTRREIFERFSGFDEEFAPAYYEETDFCVRLKKNGYGIVYNPNVVVRHFEFGSSTSSAAAIALQAANQVKFRRRHDDFLRMKFASSEANISRARFSESRNPNILVIDDQVPFDHLGSGFPRARELLNALAAQGARVNFWPMRNFEGNWAEIRSVLSNRIEVTVDDDRSFSDHIRKRWNSLDAIWISRPHNMARFLDECLDLLKLPERPFLIYDAEALFFEREKLKAGIMGTEPDRDAEATEVGLLEIADAICVVSPLEARIVAQRIDRPIAVLGTSVEPLISAAGFDERSEILFVGPLYEDGTPNTDSVYWFCSEILPAVRRLLGTDIRLTVVGRCQAPALERFKAEYLTVVGEVEDLGPYFDRARVFVGPTRFAAGISLKLIESARRGVPIVSTDLLARQLGWTDGVELLSADDAETFARNVARVFSDASVWAALRDAAAERVERDYSSAQFASVIAGLLDLGQRKTEH